MSSIVRENTITECLIGYAFDPHRIPRAAKQNEQESVPFTRYHDSAGYASRHSYRHIGQDKKIFPFLSQFYALTAQLAAQPIT